MLDMDINDYLFIHFKRGSVLYDKNEVTNYENCWRSPNFWRHFMRNALKYVE